jgi:hypothetical protein
VESVARYLEAIQEINLAQEELDQIVKTVETAARFLPEHWAVVSVVDSKEPFVPSVPANKQVCSISAPQWPSVSRIASALSQMHRAHDAAEAAWTQIEPEFRGRLVPPPKRFPNPELDWPVAPRS